VGLAKGPHANINLRMGIMMQCYIDDRPQFAKTRPHLRVLFTETLRHIEYMAIRKSVRKYLSPVLGASKKNHQQEEVASIIDSIKNKAS